MRFLVDESTGSRVARALAENHDVKFVVEIQPGMKDTPVLAIATQEQRILITNDKDFGELVFRGKEKHAGVILLRLKEDYPETRIEVLERLISQFGEKLENRFTVATETKVRIRK